MDTVMNIFAIMGIVISIIVVILFLFWGVCFFSSITYKTFKYNLKEYTAVKKEHIHEKFIAYRQRQQELREQNAEHKEELLQIKLVAKNELFKVKKEKLKEKESKKIEQATSQPFHPDLLEINKPKRFKDNDIVNLNGKEQIENSRNTDFEQAKIDEVKEEKNTPTKTPKGFPHKELPNCEQNKQNKNNFKDINELNENKIDKAQIIDTKELINQSNESIITEKENQNKTQAINAENTSNNENDTTLTKIASIEDLEPTENADNIKKYEEKITNLTESKQMDDQKNKNANDA